MWAAVAGRDQCQQCQQWRRTAEQVPATDNTPHRVTLSGQRLLQCWPLRGCSNQILSSAAELGDTADTADTALTAWHETAASIVTTVSTVTTHQQQHILIGRDKYYVNIDTTLLQSYLLHRLTFTYNGLRLQRFFNIQNKKIDMCLNPDYTIEINNLVPILHLFNFEK